MSELAERHELVDVRTGEVLPATVENAHRVLTIIREVSAQMRLVRQVATDFIADESKRRGTKTLHSSAGDVVLSGGPTIDYDPEALADALRAADCPEDRINECVVPTVTYKVNRSVLNQLVKANPDYKAAAELAEVEVMKSWSASAK